MSTTASKAYIFQAFHIYEEGAHSWHWEVRGGGDDPGAEAVYVEDGKHPEDLDRLLIGCGPDALRAIAKAITAIADAQDKEPTQ